MSATPPRLSPEDLGRELSHLFETRHRSLHAAFYGTGDAGEVRAKVLGDSVCFQAHPVDCELRLREVLAEADDAPVVLLVEYTDRLPLDVQGRLAKGRLHFISRERRLANLFGAKSVAPPLLDSPLADALLREAQPFRPGIEGRTVSLAVAWRRWLMRHAELVTPGDLTEEVFLAHCASVPCPDALQKTLEKDEALARGAQEFVRAQAGPVAEIAWRAWLTGAGLAVASLAFVLDALLDASEDGYVRAFLDAQLEGVLPEGTTPDRTLLPRWARLASSLALREEGMGGALQQILQDADRRVAKPQLQPHLVRSRHLEAALHAAKALLAEQLQEAVVGVGDDGEGAVDAADVRAAIETYKLATKHRCANGPEHAPELARARMAVRLVAYLATRPSWSTRAEQTTPLELAYELTDHFCTDGGFVDYARRLVRSGRDDNAMSKAFASVVSAADRVRDAMDSHFGKGLARWNDDRREGRLLPIERALHRLGLDFLQAGRGRRLLILVMDGMAWPTAAELMLDLADEGVGPLRWQPKATVSSGMPAPMIAALPTMTEISRAALFAGKLPKPGEKLSTLRDPERLADHKAFVQAYGQGPRLLLRTEAEDDAGHVTAEALALVRSEDRVVAVVANAVDDMLSAKPSYQGQYNRDTIKALRPLLQAARQAKRAVLLLADHGHVLSDRERQRVKVEGADSPRYRELSDGELVSDRELVLQGPNAYCSKKTRKLALLVGESERYRDVHHLGEHGGGSLSEVVTPALLVGSDDLFQAVGDEEDQGLETVAFPVPAWWQLELPTSQQRAVPEPAPSPPKKTRRPKTDSQLDMFEAKPVPAPTPKSERPSKPPERQASAWAVRLDREFAKESKPRRKNLQEYVLPALDLLLEHGGRMSTDVLAGKMAVHARKVGGLVAMMGEFLNLDGYEVVRHNVTAKQVELDEPMLAELFGGEDA